MAIRTADLAARDLLLHNVPRPAHHKVGDIPDLLTEVVEFEDNDVGLTTVDALCP